MMRIRLWLMTTHSKMSRKADHLIKATVKM
jgi:hypothetical protein